jgi:ABC-2 type transport system permease protein
MTLQLFKKEFLHILRDWGLMIFIIYAFTLDIYIAAKGLNIIPELVSVNIMDEDRSAASREFTQRIRPPAFREPVMLSDRRSIDRLLNESETVLVLDIPSGFERDIYRDGATVQLLVDGTQSTAAYLSSAYIGLIARQYSEDLLRDRLRNLDMTGLPAIDLRSRIYFNPEARDRYFEGINEFFMVFTLIGLILPASIIIREKEYGTLEQIMISPLGIKRLLVMKLLSASLFLLAVTALSYEFVLKLWLHIPLKGTLLGFLGISLVYSIATSGLSFIIASVAKRLSQIGMLTIMIFAPMLLLSGGWVPPEALPSWLRALSVISPMKYYLDSGISLLIRGADFDLLLPNLIRLILLGAIFLGAGYILYDKRILHGEG